MTQSTAITLPEDLAKLLIDDGVAAETPPDMAAEPGLIEAVADVAATVINLIQGPIAVAQITIYLRAWRERRARQGRGVGVIEIRRPTGSITLDLDNDANLAEAGRALSELFTAVKPATYRRAIAFDDDTDLPRGND